MDYASIHVGHRWVSGVALEAVCMACVDHELGTGSSVCGSWTWHRKQRVWIMNLAQEAAYVDLELNMPNMQFIKINSHDSVWFFSVRFHLEGGKWHLCDLPSKYWGKRHLLRWKTAALLVSSCQFMKNLKKGGNDGEADNYTQNKTIFPDSKQNYKSNLE